MRLGFLSDEACNRFSFPFFSEDSFPVKENPKVPEEGEEFVGF